MPVERVIVEADGGSRGNPGPAGYGAVVRDADTGAVLAERKAALGIETNNVAEYRGLIAGLTAARELGARRVAVRCDSKLVVEQMKGTWQVKNEALRKLVREAVELRSGFDEVSFEWVPRARNTHADRLANEAMDEAAGKSARAPRAARAVAVESATQQGLWVPPVEAPTRLVLVRHGATVHSVDKRFSGRNDLPLSETGEQQAAALAKRAGSFGDIAAIVSSPLRRCRQTAAVIADSLGREVDYNDDLAEVDFGTWEGLTFGEVSAQDPDALAAWLGSPDIAPPNGESFTAHARRVRRGRDAVIAAHPGRTVVVVTHVTPIKTLVQLALDAPPVALFRLQLDTASVSVVDYYADGNCAVRLFNDTSHLA